MKVTSVHIRSVIIRFEIFATAFRVRKLSRTFEKLAIQEVVNGFGIQFTLSHFLVTRRDFQCISHTLQRAHQFETWFTLLRYVINLLSNTLTVRMNVLLVKISR